MMKYLIIIFLLLNVSLLYSQSIDAPEKITINGYPDAVIVGRDKYEGYPDPTCAIFTYNPRVEEGYYKVDIYALRPKSWSVTQRFLGVSKLPATTADYISFSNSLGGFEFNFRALGRTTDFHKMYELAPISRFVPNEDLTRTYPSVEIEQEDEETGEMVMVSKPLKSPVYEVMNMNLAPGSFGGSYAMNQGDFPIVKILLATNKPYYLGTVELKIKSTNTTQTSCIALKETACAVNVYGLENKDDVACWNHKICGWLDGKDPDIPLTPEGPTLPDAPVFASNQTDQFCGYPTTATYKISTSTLPANATECVWYASTSAKGAPVGTATCTPQNSGVSCQVTWNAAGTYFLNVFSKNGTNYSDTVSMQVTVNPKPTAGTLAVTGAVTENGRLAAYSGTNLTGTVGAATGGTAPLKYGWLQPNSITAITGTKNLTYKMAMGNSNLTFQAYVEDSNGCRDTSNTVMVYTKGKEPKLIVDADSCGPFCANGAVVLRVKTVTDGDGNYTYSWTASNGVLATPLETAEITVTERAIYTVTVTDGNKVKGSDVVNLENYAPGLTAPALAVSGSTVYTIPSGSQTVMSLTCIQGTPPYAWNWSPADKIDGSNTVATPQTVALTSQQKYTVYVKDQNNCQSKNSDARVDISNTTGLDVMVFPQTVELCQNNHQQLTTRVNGVFNNTASGITYQWSPADLVSNPNIADPVFTSAVAMDTTLTVTVTRSGLKAIGKVKIKVKNAVAPTMQLAGSSLPQCIGDQMTVTATPSNSTIKWIINGAVSTGNNYHTFTAAADQYDVKVVATDLNNCTSDTLSKTFKVDAPPTNLALALSSGNSGVLCGDQDKLSLTGTGLTAADSVVWYKGTQRLASGKDMEYTLSEAGTYKVKAWKGACPAEAAYDIQMKISEPTVTRLAVVDSCGIGQMEVVASPATSYKWTAKYGSTITNSDQAKASIDVLGTHQLTVVITNGNGNMSCKVSRDLSITVKEKPDIDFVDNTLSCQGEILSVVDRNPVTAGATYSWKKNNSTISANAGKKEYALTEVGTYTIEAIAEYQGCRDVASIANLTVNPKPVLAWLQEPPTTEVETGVDIVASVEATNGTPNYSYTWLKPGVEGVTDNSSVYTVTADALHGTYNFQAMVEDSKGCKDTTEVKSTPVKGADLIVSVTARHNAKPCLDGSLILDVDVQNAVGECTYTWYVKGTTTPANLSPYTANSDTAHVVLNNLDGNFYTQYTVKVECPGTLGSGEASIDLPAFDGAHQSLLVEADPDIYTVKSGASTVLLANVKARGILPEPQVDYTWYWEGKILAGEENLPYPQTQNLTTSEDYQVYVIDANSCMSNVDQARVNIDATNGFKIVVAPETDLAICQNKSVQLSVTAKSGNLSGATYVWNTSGGTLSDVNSATPRFVSDQAGTYVVTATVTKGGYTAVVKKTITVLTDAAPILAFEGDVTQWCSNEPMLVTGDADNDNIQWIIDGTNTARGGQYTLPAGTTGTHDVKVYATSSINSCVSDTIAAKVYEMPQILTFPADQMVAKGSIVTTGMAATITPTTGVTGTWVSDPAGRVATSTLTAITKTAAITDSTEFIYTLANAQAARCAVKDSFDITVAPSNFRIEASKQEVTLCMGDELTFEVTPKEAATGTIKYTYTSDMAGFTEVVSAGVIGNDIFSSTKFTTAGDYELYVRAEDADAAIARDTVKVKVNPKPEVTLTENGQTIDICGRNPVNLNLKLTGGLGWTVYYTVGGSAASQTFNKTNNVFTIASAGELVIDSVRNVEGCSVKTDLPTVTINDVQVSYAVADENLPSCAGVGEEIPIQLKLTNPKYPVTIYYRKDGVDKTAVIQDPGAGHEPELKVDGPGQYVLDSIENNGGCRGYAQNNITKNVTLGTLALNLKLTNDGLDLCKGQTALDIPLLFSGDALNSSAVNGPFVVKYTFTPAAGGTAVEKSLSVLLADAKAGTAVIADAELGTYILTGVEEDGKCPGALSSVASENQLKVAEKPVAEIDSIRSFAKAKGEEFVLGVMNPQTKYTYTWTSDPENAFTDAGNHKINGTMADADLQYVLTASTTTSTCTGTDTVNVYRLPDAPTIRIDTNTTRNDIKIHWTPDGKSTYALMSIKWDGYGVLNDYALRQSLQAADSSFILNQNQLDTLEFFYVTAGRYIKELKKTVYSPSSDTVGYRYDKFHVNSDATKTSNDVLPWIFDMPSLPTSDKLFDLIGTDNMKQISSWQVVGQGWYNTTKYNKMHEIMPDRIEKYSGIFDLNRGEAYLLSIGNDFNVLQYGKLMELPERKMEYTAERTNNYVFTVDIRKIPLLGTDDLFHDIKIENLNSVSTWDFENQGWYNTTKYNKMHEIMPDRIPEFDNIFKIKPGMPVQLNIKQAFIWK